MPIYCYECKKCGERFELLVGMTADQSKLECVECGNSRLDKLVTTFAITGSSKGGSSSCANCSSGSCSNCSCGH